MTDVWLMVLGGLGLYLQVLSVAIRYTAGFARSTYGDINSTFNGQFPPVPLVPADSAVGGIDKALPLFD